MADGIPDAARWPTTHGRVRYAAARTKPSGSRRLRPPRGSPATRGGTRDRRTAGAGPARGGCPLPACGEPMRIKPHQIASTRTPGSPFFTPFCSCWYDRFENHLRRPVLGASLSAPKALAAAPPERPPPTSTPCQRHGFSRPQVCPRADPRRPMPTRRPSIAAHRLCAWRRGCRCCWHGVARGWHGVGTRGRTFISACLVTRHLHFPASSACVSLFQVPMVHVISCGEPSVQPFVVLAA